MSGGDHRVQVGPWYEVPAKDVVWKGMTPKAIAHVRDWIVDGRPGPIAIVVSRGLSKRDARDWRKDKDRDPPESMVGGRACFWRLYANPTDRFDTDIHSRVSRGGACRDAVDGQDIADKAVAAHAKRIGADVLDEWPDGVDPFLAKMRHQGGGRRPQARGERASSRTTPAGGRPTKCTEATTERICGFVRQGVPDAVAARLCGIGVSTFEEWKRKGRKAKSDTRYRRFLESLTRAKDEAVLSGVERQNAHAYIEHKANEWMLARLCPEVFGQPGQRYSREQEAEDLDLERQERILAIEEKRAALAEREIARREKEAAADLVRAKATVAQAEAEKVARGDKDAMERWREVMETEGELDAFQDMVRTEVFEQERMRRAMVRSGQIPPAPGDEAWMESAEGADGPEAVEVDGEADGDE